MSICDAALEIPGLSCPLDHLTTHYPRQDELLVSYA
jgi:hypothetical protein